jgi:hypothetical protein
MPSLLMPFLLMLLGGPFDTVANEDRSGPTRQAWCQIGNEQVQPCRFTPVLGNGSFDIALPHRELRLVIDARRGNVFEVFGPERRVLLPSRYHRDSVRSACWLSDIVEEDPSKICVYRSPNAGHTR